MNVKENPEVKNDFCKGLYRGANFINSRWSKTMVGYGPEDSHFVVELTYNYNISSYKLGNDFQVNVSCTIVSFL